VTARLNCSTSVVLLSQQLAPGEFQIAIVWSAEQKFVSTPAAIFGWQVNHWAAIFY